MKKKEFFQLSLAIIICEAAGAIGSVFTAPAIKAWYATLIRPEIAPPNWIFAPVWTALFALMGAAVFLVWNKGRKKAHAKVALIIFGIQLVLNIVWSMIFFGMHNPGGSLIEIIFLWLAIAATICAFARISKSAAWLLAPYILWVSFAAYLNYSFFILN
jgi:tryptophan-rich sensory protein